MKDQILIAHLNSKSYVDLLQNSNEVYGKLTRSMMQIRLHKTFTYPC